MVLLLATWAISGVVVGKGVVLGKQGPGPRSLKGLAHHSRVPDSVPMKCRIPFSSKS